MKKYILSLLCLSPLLSFCQLSTNEQPVSWNLPQVQARVTIPTKLTEDPKEISGFSPYYLGWDCVNHILAGGVGIHHPSGDAKKISTYTQIPDGSSGNFWILYWIQTENGYSVTEGGIFNGIASGPIMIDNLTISEERYFNTIRTLPQQT